APAARAARTWLRDEAIVELIRGRLSIVGPTTARTLAASLGIDAPDADRALAALESEGAVLRGSFTGTAEREWCDRRLLARIHRYTISRLRAEIEPVTPADFMRFLLHWQHVLTEDQVSGVEGLAAVVEQLDGYELAAAAWEHDVLRARVRDYTSNYIDMLCLSGRVAWVRTTPM